MTTNENFESYVSEFKESRENVINVLRMVLEEEKEEEFENFLKVKDEETSKQMKAFIQSKYYEFVESIDNIKECKNVVKSTDDVLNSLENSVQEFLYDFNGDFVERIRKKEKLKNVIKEKEKLNTLKIIIAYITKAHKAVDETQFELAIRLIKFAKEKFLKKFPSSSDVSKRCNEIISYLENRIITTLEERMTKWLIDVNKEQTNIGESLFRKIKNDSAKKEKNDFFSGGVGKSTTSMRNTKSIVDSLLLIRGTSNLNYMVNKNSVLKSSIVNADYNEDIEYDIINMVANVDLKFIDQSYSIYKSLGLEMKFIESFRSFRYGQISQLVKLDNKGISNIVQKYDTIFAAILGYIVIQISIFELYPQLYSKRKFEDEMSYLTKELQSNLSYEYDSFDKTTQFITLERSCSIFLSAIDRIGVNEKIGINIRSLIVEMTKEKIISLNILLISKYNNMFSRMIIDDLSSNGLVANNADEFIKYATQYSITLETSKNEINNMIYPYKLPYTEFVVNVNENVKRYVDEIFEFVRPLYDDYDGIIPEMVRDFLKKLNEVFIFFANSQEMDINIISLAQICNNIKYILQSHSFYVDYVKKKCNIKTYINLYSEKPLKEVAESYEEMIYEQLKKMIKRFLSDLTGDDWLPTKPRNEANSYVEGMIAYLNVIYMNLQTLSSYYIETCFKDALKFSSKLYIEILFNEKYLPNYNYYAIKNLKNDIDALDEYFREIDLTYKDFSSSLIPIKNIIDFFDNKKIDIFITENNKLDKFYKIGLKEFIKFLQRFKNLKVSKEQKGKISESEINSILKKNKNLIASN